RPGTGRLLAACVDSAPDPPRAANAGARSPSVDASVPEYSTAHHRFAAGTSSGVAVPSLDAEVVCLVEARRGTGRTHSLGARSATAAPGLDDPGDQPGRDTSGRGDDG